MKPGHCYKTILVAACCSAAALPAIAAVQCEKTTPCADTPYLEEILVTGTRTARTLLYSPNALALVDEETMRWHTSESLAEALRDIPGVTIIDAGQAGMKRIRIRGEESYRVAVLVDGQEITDHRGEGVPLTLDPALVERIEVIKGAGSVLYGPKALGGVINFITRKGGDRPLQLTAASGWDSATGGEQYFASAYGSAAGFDYRVSFAKDQQGNRQTPAGEIDNTESASDSVSVYLGKRWNNHRLGISWEDHDAYSEVFVEDEVRFSFPFSEFELEIPQRDRRKTALFYDWTDVLENLRKVHLDAYRQVSDRQFHTYWEQALFGMEKQTFSESQLVTEGALAQLDWRLGDSHYLITGAHYTLDRVDQDRLELLSLSSPASMTIPTEVYDRAELQTLALFVQDEWQLSDSVAVTAGIRQYWVDSELKESTRADLTTPDKEDSELIASMAAIWEVTDGSVLRAAYSEGYMYPSLLQLAIGGVERIFVNPDPELQTENSQTWELGWRYAGDRLQLDMTLFNTEAENYIDHVPCTDPACVGGTRRAPAEIYVNIGEAKTTGLEAYLEYQLGDSLKPYTAVTLLLRENYFEDFSTRDAGLPAISGVLGVKHQRTVGDRGRLMLDAYLRGESAADQLDENRNEHHNGGWVSFNLELGFAFGREQRYRLALELLNMTDKRYSTATENLWAPERSLQARFTLDL